MNKSSIHVLPVKAGSESHNQREKELSYVRSDLSRLNSAYIIKSIADAKAFAEKNGKEKTGRAMQAKATPIREGVLLIGSHHTADDLKKLADKIELRFDIKTIQGYCHKDEGHYDKETKEWKPNYHAHMVFDWTDHATGKSIKMSRDDMAELQTIVAESLGLERGVSSSKVHLNAIQYKSQQEQKDLGKIHSLKNGLSEVIATIERGQTIIKEIEPLRKMQQHLSSELETLQATKKQYSDSLEQQRQQAIEQHEWAGIAARKVKEIQQQQEQYSNLAEQEKRRAVEQGQQAEVAAQKVREIQQQQKLYSDLAEQERQRAIEQMQQAEVAAQKVREIQAQLKQYSDLAEQEKQQVIEQWQQAEVAAQRVREIQAEQKQYSDLAEQEKQRAVEQEQQVKLETQKLRKIQADQKWYSDSAKREEHKAVEQMVQAELETRKIKEIQAQKEQLIEETELHRANLKHIEEKGKEQIEQIKENEKVIQQQEQKIQKSRGFGFGR